MNEEYHTHNGGGEHSVDNIIKNTSENIIFDYSAIKRNEIMPLQRHGWMNLESVILSEVSLKEKDKYHMISLICGI